MMVGDSDLSHQSYSIQQKQTDSTNISRAIERSYKRPLKNKSPELQVLIMISDIFIIPFLSVGYFVSMMALPWGLYSLWIFIAGYFTGDKKYSPLGNFIFICLLLSIYYWHIIK
jgi:hypothetical protein